MRLQAANSQTEAKKKKIPGYLPVTSTQLSTFSHGLSQPVCDSGAGLISTCLCGVGKSTWAKQAEEGEDRIVGKDGQ